MTAFYAFMVMLSSVSFQGDSSIIPERALGRWTGSMGDEGDTMMYSVQFDIRNKPDTSRMTIAKPCQEFFMVFEFADSDQVRFFLKPMVRTDTAVCSGGTIDLLTVDYFPSSMLHVQFYPNGTDAVWLGEITRKK